jgi:hypothetical protein
MDNLCPDLDYLNSELDSLNQDPNPKIRRFKYKKLYMNSKGSRDMSRLLHTARSARKSYNSKIYRIPDKRLKIILGKVVSTTA